MELTERVIARHRTTDGKADPTSASSLHACDQVLISLRRILRAIDLHSRRLVQNHGVTGPQALLLRSLVRHEPMAVGELARSLQLSQATVTEILDRLEGRGLIRRVRSRADRRRVLVRTTGAGKALLERAPPLLQDGFIEAFEHLPQRERKRILDALHKIADMMDVPDLDAAPVLATGPIAPDDSGDGPAP